MHTFSEHDKARLTAGHSREAKPRHRPGPWVGGDCRGGTGWSASLSEGNTQRQPSLGLVQVSHCLGGER